MASLVKARAARKAQLDKKRQEEEEARKKAEEEKNPPKPTPPPSLEKPTESIPQSSPPPVLEKKEETSEPSKIVPPDDGHTPEKKIIQPGDLFLIPPSFSFVDLQDKMNNVTISPVPTTTKFVPKKTQPPLSTTSEKQQNQKQKKRKREESESSDNEEESDSDNEPTNPSSTGSTQPKKIFQSKFQQQGANKAVAKPSRSTSSSLMEKARGLYNQTTSYIPSVTDSIRNNLFLSAVSVLLIIVRGALQQRHLGRMQAAPPMQNIQASLPPSNPPPPTNYTYPPTSYNMTNPGDYRGYGK